MPSAGINLHLVPMQCPNGDRDTKLNITMDDEDPDNSLLQAMSPLYDKCAKVTGMSGHLSKPDFILNRGHRQELAYAKMHLTERRNVERSAFRRLLYKYQEGH